MYTVRSKNGHKRYVQRLGKTAWHADFEALISAAQNGNLLQLLTRKLHGLNLHVVTNAELIDRHKLIAAFQPGPRFDG